jgi:hypothetical protein
VTIVLMALLALFFAVGSTTGTGVTATPVSRPALTVESMTPLVVRGTGFQPGEQVTVTAHRGARPQTVTVKAVRGSFRANMRMATSKCGGVRVVRALGDKGSVATVPINGGICVPPPRN